MMKYSERLSLLYALCLNENRDDSQNPSPIPSTNIADYDPLEAANYLACFITFKAMQQAERSPVDEHIENFDILSVYQTYAMLVYAFLVLPLGEEKIAPETEAAAIIVTKTLFAGLPEQEWVEIIESGGHKFQLIADATQDHWVTYRQDLDKATIAFVIAGTDEETPFDKDDVIPMFGALLSMLCEAFASD
jgi:hypothetical protein